MSADAHKPTGLPYSGKMMRWARERRRISVEDAAQKMGVPASRLEGWELGKSVPTLRQGRQLAEYYRRPFLEFFYDTPPEIVESRLIPDFRTHRSSPDPKNTIEILDIQHWAEAQRLNALDLYQEIGEAPPLFPIALSASLDGDPDVFAYIARDILKFTITEQRRLTQAEFANIPGILRDRIEQVGILVLRENKLPQYGVSGLCIAKFPLPVILFSSESPGRQAFTIMHEFAHIMLGESAISDNELVKNSTSHGKKVERWCNRFAGAFLIPHDALAQLRGEPGKPAESIADDTLDELARSFRVSAHAMLIRLVHLGYVNPAYYWDVKYPQFREQEDSWQGGGRPSYYASRFVNKLGNLYTNLVLEAWGTGRIPFHQAADFMGLKNPSHLPIIRQEFRGT